MTCVLPQVLADAWSSPVRVMSINRELGLYFCSWDRLKHTLSFLHIVIFG